MIGNRYRGIRAILIEGDTSMRRNLRSVLVGNGMRDVVHGQALTTLLDAVAQEMFDLILCDVGVLGSEFPEAIQQIRQNRLGRNPFVVIVATSLDTSEDRVRGTLNGGVDDLIGKPASVNQLLERIGNLVDARKPFVATETYVGPTRRRNVRPGENDHDLVRVPNTMHGKMVERLGDGELARIVDDGAGLVEEKKAQSPFSGIDRLIHNSLARYDEAGNGEQLRRDFDHLLDWSRELREGHRDSAWSSIAELLAALVDVVERITSSATRPRKADLELLSNLGTVIRRSVTVDQLSGMPPRLTSSRPGAGFKPRPESGLGWQRVQQRESLRTH